jgi:hypothetical protein
MQQLTELDSNRLLQSYTGCTPFFPSGADLSRPYIGGENMRLPGKSSTRCIRFAQHATDLGAPSIPLGWRAVYYRSGSAKVFHSIPFRSCDELAVHQIFVKTGDIPTTLTPAVRVLQSATDPFQNDAANWLQSCL